MSTTQAMDGFSRTLGAQYDVEGKRTQLTHPDGNWFGFGYDNLDRMVTIGRNWANGLTGYGYNNWTYYGYDAVGRLNALTQDIAGSAYDLGFTYGYNPASQLTTQVTGNDAYVWRAEWL